MAGAIEALMLIVELGGPTMFARIGVMRALNRLPQGPLGKMLEWIPIVRPRGALILCGEA